MYSNKKRTPASTIALGGMLAAAALVVMCLGGMIPVATYVCPVVCMLVLQAVKKICGDRIAWAWFGAVSLLGLLMGPDKEAAAVFLFIGYYPIVKPKLDGTKLHLLWKALLFNGSMILMYWILLHVIGMAELAEEFSDMNAILMGILLLLGNVVFWMVDFILSGKIRRRKRHG